MFNARSITAPCALLMASAPCAIVDTPWPHWLELPLPRPTSASLACPPARPATATAPARPASLPTAQEPSLLDRNVSSALTPIAQSAHLHKQAPAPVASSPTQQMLKESAKSAVQLTIVPNAEATVTLALFALRLTTWQLTELASPAMQAATASNVRPPLFSVQPVLQDFSSTLTPVKVVQPMDIASNVPLLPGALCSTTPPASPSWPYPPPKTLLQPATPAAGAVRLPTLRSAQNATKVST